VDVSREETTPTVRPRLQLRLGAEVIVNLRLVLLVLALAPLASCTPPGKWLDVRVENRASIHDPSTLCTAGLRVTGGRNRSAELASRTVAAGGSALLTAGYVPHAAFDPSVRFTLDAYCLTEGGEGHSRREFFEGSDHWHVKPPDGQPHPETVIEPGPVITRSAPPDL
jgi:hypothetical protein